MLTGFPQSLHVVASALAVGMKVGAIRDGAPATQFASDIGLGDGDAAAACQLAARRAVASPPDVLVASASAFAQIVEQLDAIRVGAGQQWAAGVLETARNGVTPMAARLRLLLMSASEVASPGRLGRSHPGQEPLACESSLPRSTPSESAQPKADTSVPPAEPTELTFDDDWTEEAEQDLLAGDAVPDDLGVDGGAEDDDIELDDDDGDSDDDGPLLTDEAIDDLLADDSVDLDDDWMEDKPAT